MREIVQGASISLGVRVVTGILTFALNVVVARTLGAERAGLFFLALTVVTIAAILGQLGLDAAVVRFVAAVATGEHWGRVKGIARHARLMTAGASVVLAAVLAIGAGWGSTAVFGKPELAEVLMWMSLAIVPFALMQLQSQLLKGLKRILFSQIPLVVLPAAAIPAILILGSAYATPGASAGYALAAVLGAGASWALWRIVVRSMPGKPDMADRRDLKLAARSLLVVSALYMLMNWSAPLLVGVWMPASDVALYNVAHRTAFLTTIVLASVNSIAAPKFAELYHAGNLAALGATARNSARMMLLLAVPVLAFFVAAPSFVMALFGSEFVTGSTLLVILAIGQFVNVSTGSVGLVLIMSGREKVARNNVAVAATLNVVLQVVLIPRYGALGAAIATSVSIAMLNLSAAYLVHRELGIMTLPVRFREAK